MKSPSLWPAVVLVVSTIAAVTVLLALGVEMKELLDLLPILVVPLLLAALGKLQTVQTQTNGTTSALVQTVDQLRADNARLTELLARSAPATPLGDPPSQAPAQSRHVE